MADINGSATQSFELPLTSPIHPFCGEEASCLAPDDPFILRAHLPAPAAGQPNGKPAAASSQGAQGTDCCFALPCPHGQEAGIIINPMAAWHSVPGAFGSLWQASGFFIRILSTSPPSVSPLALTPNISPSQTLSPSPFLLTCSSPSYFMPE